MKPFLYFSRAWSSVTLPFFWLVTIFEDGYGAVLVAILLVAMSVNFAWWWSEQREREAGL